MSSPFSAPHLSLWVGFLGDAGQTFVYGLYLLPLRGQGSGASVYGGSACKRPPAMGLSVVTTAVAAAREVAGTSDPDAIVKSEAMRAAIREKFAAYNKAQSGSSSRVRRVILMAEPPSVDGHEITDKGYVNQRATMDRRRALVDKLFAAAPDSEVIEIG